MARPSFPALWLACALLASGGASAAQPATNLLEPAKAAIRVKDFTRARDALLPLARGGDAEAQFLLASILLAGLAGEPDVDEARRLLEQSATQQHARAAWSLATLLATGDPPDPGAQKWFDEARRLGLPAAEDAAARGGLPFEFRPAVDLPDEQARVDALWRAAATGDLKTLASLASGSVLGSRDEFGRDALARAAGAGDPAAVRQLLERGAHADIADRAGVTALMLAAGAGSAPTVDALLTQKGVGLDAADKTGNTALMYAAGSGSLAAVEKLLAAGASVKPRNAQDWSALDFAQMAGEKGESAVIAARLAAAGATALSHTAMVTTAPTSVRRASSRDGYAGWPDVAVAATRSDTTLLTALLARGANANAALPDGTPVLQVAVRARAARAVEALLNAGADSRRADRQGETALSLAARAGDAAIIRLLLAHGAGADAGPALLAAVRSARFESVQALLVGQARPDVADEAARSALMYAAVLPEPALTRALLDAGANANLADARGRTAIWYAAQAGQLPALALLAERSTALEKADRDGLTPLAAAAEAGQGAAVKFLLGAHVATDTRDQHGATPLLLAAGGGHAEIVGQLLAAGVDKDAQDAYGDTALMVAIRTGSADTAAMLLRAGASKRLRNREQASAADIATARALPQIVSLLRDSR